MRTTEIGNCVKKKIVKYVSNMKTETLKTSCSHTHHDHNLTHDHDIHETKTKIVALISVLAMVAEIFFGYITNSMALLSDGWHMASHVLAIGLTWFAYIYCRKNKTNTRYKSGTDKILSLSGYTSGLLLMAIALWMAIECVIRIFSAENILYNDAILVAIIGLAVNIVCAFILSITITMII
jgi:cation diffusion facilitator family transporter